MGDDDREDLERLGYDDDDIDDRGLRIEHDDDELVVVDYYGDEQGRHDEARTGPITPSGAPPLVRIDSIPITRES